MRSLYFGQDRDASFLLSIAACSRGEHRATTLAIAATGAVLLVAWNVWFCFARVWLFVTSERARVEAVGVVSVDQVPLPIVPPPRDGSESPPPDVAPPPPRYPIPSPA